MMSTLNFSSVLLADMKRVSIVYRMGFRVHVD